MKLRNRAVKPPRIEMMPLIDIVFLLLVFFIYAMLSMAVHQGVTLDLPQSSTADRSEEKNSLSISIRSRGEMVDIFMDKQQVPLGELGDRLPAINGKTEERPTILLFADKQVSYQQLYRVLDELKKANFSNISLQAEAK